MILLPKHQNRKPVFNICIAEPKTEIIMGGKYLN